MPPSQSQEFDEYHKGSQILISICRCLGRKISLSQTPWLYDHVLGGAISDHKPFFVKHLSGILVVIIVINVTELQKRAIFVSQNPARTLNSWEVMVHSCSCYHLFSLMNSL